ncbi:MAG: methyl-accepting chemotaxis protein [Treponema sp.]|jgi:methyl-accepting chemotaxis protein|nr:methyl-accepting chemotaxis protein [Treponema sp.]
MTIKRASGLINALAICFILLAGALLLYLSRKIAETDKAAADRYYSMLLVEELRNSSEELTRQVRLYSAGHIEAEAAYNKVLTVRNGQEPRPADAQVAPGQKWVLLDLLKTYGITAEEFILVEKANALSDSLVSLEVEAMNAAKGIFKDSLGNYTVHGEPDREFALNLVFSDAYLGEVARIMAPMDEFQTVVTERTGRTLEEASDAQSAAEVVSAAALALVFLVAVFNLLFNQAAVIGPLSGITAVLKTVVIDGKTYLGKRIDFKSKNEIGELAGFFNKTFEDIGDLIGVIKTKTGSLTNTGVELSTNITQTATAVKHISSNIDSIRGLVTKQQTGASEAGAAVERINANIGSLNKAIEEQAGSVNMSSSSVEEMAANIHSVTQTLIENGENVKVLAEASENGRMGLQTVVQDIQAIARESEGLLEINAVMENIASQTNLLSMNAAIEAAHAGEAGKGFAVVADEIRKLAESSGDQSKTTTAMLKKIKTSIDNITKSSDEVLARFEAINTGVNTVAEHEQNIRAAMEEQEAGGKQILESIALLNDITGTVKQGSENMTAASGELLKETGALMEISEETANGMNEMVGGVNQINIAVSGIDNMSTDNKMNIDTLTQEMEKFVTETQAEAMDPLTQPRGPQGEGTTQPNPGGRRRHRYGQALWNLVRKQRN